MYPVISPTTIDGAAFVIVSRMKQPHSIPSLAPSVSRIFYASVCDSMCRFMIRFIIMTPYISANMSDTLYSTVSDSAMPLTRKSMLLRLSIKCSIRTASS